MEKRIKILGIAPYEELNHSMHTIASQYKNVDTTIYTADLVEGQQLATQLSPDGFDAIISRGGTAKLIRKAVTLPVIDVSLSVYDILRAIRLAESYTTLFSIVGYPTITENAHLLCELLNYDIEIHTISSESDAADVLDTLVEKGNELILCDAITNRIALTKSINTLLITSGFESIRHAYDEAISIITQLDELKEQRMILEEGIHAQKLPIFIFDQQFRLHFSSVPSNQVQVILHSLKSKQDIKSTHQYYSVEQKKFYTLKIVSYLVNQKKFYLCEMREHMSSAIQKRIDIIYQKKNDVLDRLNTKMIFPQFIPENIKNQLKKMSDLYSSYIIFGEKGTAKKNIAYQLYLNQKKHTNYFITIDCNLITDKTWKYLVNATNGPFVDTHNTLLFVNIEQLDLKGIKTLLSYIEMTNVVNHNTLLFTFDTNSDNIKNLDMLTNELHSATIYAPSVRERKNELNILTTLLVNKLNIETNKEVLGFDPGARQTLLSFDWPGNFNQLQNVIKELVIHSSSHYISEYQVIELLNKERLLYHFQAMQSSKGTEQPVNFNQHPTLLDYIKAIIQQVLNQNDGNQTKTAEQLGISRTTLWRYLKGE